MLLGKPRCRRTGLLLADGYRGDVFRKSDAELDGILEHPLVPVDVQVVPPSMFSMARALLAREFHPFTAFPPE